MKKGLKLRHVKLSQQAFIGMITSSIEVYKKECFGLIIGSKHKTYYYAYDALPYQSADRDYESVTLAANRCNKMNHALQYLTTHQVIGDYHSHPEGPDRLSSTDAIDIKEIGGELTMLISVRKTTKFQKWQWNDDLSISGTIGKKYKIKIKAFEYAPKHKVIAPIKIVCPYVKKLNKLKLYQRALRKFMC